MKKIFLLALLLGLTGCGNDNQNGASQTNSSSGLGGQTVAKTMSASSLALGGWAITNTSAVGASTLLDGAKDIRVSTALITPNATDVAKVLRGGAAGIALSLAVDQILGAVDWVLDPANNQIIYTEKNPVNFPFSYTAADYGVGNSEYDAIKSYFKWLNENNYGFQGAIVESYASCTVCNGSGSWFYWGGKESRYVTVTYSNSDTTQTINLLISKAVKPSIEQTLPLETLAEQVIDNADNDNTDAQVATNAAAQAILAEAYNDAIKAQPIVTELENNAHNECSKHNAYQNSQASVIEGRYNEMYIDVHNLYRDYRTLRPGHPDGYGSWQGHIDKYKYEQKELKALIVDAVLQNCPETLKAKKWKDKDAPPRPGVNSLDPI